MMWRLKIGLKILLSRMPWGYAVWQRLGLFRHGRMDQSAYAMEVLNHHLEQAGLAGDLAGKTVLELGPGDSIATAVAVHSMGGRAILVDAGPFASGDTGVYRDLERSLRAAGRTPADLSGCRSLPEVLAACGADYRTEGLNSLKSLASESVEFIFSQAVLEHVRRGECLETLREMRRVLKPGGIGSHRIDLRDHLGGALNHLRFRREWWESDFMATSGFYTNRLGFGEWLELFAEAGFAAEVTAVRRWPRLPTPRRKLAAEFRERPDEELRVSGLDVLLRRERKEDPA